MAQVAKKQNMTIAIREYTDNQGQQKKVWKTIGELITWDDGSQSFELWGPTGSTKGNVFDKDEQQQGAPQGQPQGQPQQAPQQYAQPQQAVQHQAPAAPYQQQPAYQQK